MTMYDTRLPAEGGTPTERQGVFIMPRLPDFEFDKGLRRLWFDGSLPLTSFWSVISCFATVGEAAFIRAAKQLLPQIEDPRIADETRRFVLQEAYHSLVHERLNSELHRRGLPVEPVKQYISDMVDYVERCGVDNPVIAAALAGEQAIGEIGDAVVQNPAALDGCDAAPRALLLWHCFEEVEHGAALYDAYHCVYGHGAKAYLRRIVGLVYVLTVVVLSWNAAAYAFMEAEERGAGRRLANWREIYRHLLGREGLLRSSGHVLLHYLRPGFHPWQLRDPTHLWEHCDEFVRPEWERPPARSPATG